MYHTVANIGKLMKMGGETLGFILIYMIVGMKMTVINACHIDLGFSHIL